MKKILFLCVVIWGAICVNAQTRTDSDGNTVYHPMSFVLQYQIGDFDNAKDSGCYGFGFVISSISHWGIFHVGANTDFLVNAGIVKDWGCIIDFGPSARIDIGKNFFVNIPVNAVCVISFPKGSDTKRDWGAKIAPSIHAFFSDRVGIFVGPNVSFGSGSSSFGMQAGLSYSF